MPGHAGHEIAQVRLAYIADEDETLEDSLTGKNMLENKEQAIEANMRQLANAHLFAAAPELRKALERLSFAAECRDNTMGDPVRLIAVKAELADAAKQARAALTLADGE